MPVSVAQFEGLDAPRTGVDSRAISADILEFCARVLVILAARGAINE
jgi:hypothetical protein